MQLQIKGRNLEVSESIRTYAERKLAKLERMVHSTTRIELGTASRGRSLAAVAAAVTDPNGIDGRSGSTRISVMLLARSTLSQSAWSLLASR